MTESTTASSSTTFTRSTSWGSVISSTLQVSRWPHTWMAPMEPERTPRLTIPSIALSETLSTPALEFHSFRHAFWWELALIFLFMTALAAVMGSIVYRGCVRSDQKFTTASYLTGYGLVVPFWLIFPSTAVYYLQIHNKIYRFMMTAMQPAISIFRTTAAMHGFSPEHATHSMTSFALYYASPILARYDPKTKQYTPTSLASIQQLLVKFVTMLLITGTVVSIFHGFPTVFPLMSKPSSVETREWYDLRALLDPGHLWDNMCYAVVFQCYLTCFGNALRLLQTILTGLETEDMMNNPVFGSTSPSEFWSRRWNLVIHDVLKRGVFLPVKQYTRSVSSSSMSSTIMALMATFFASGLFHEWLLITVFATWDHHVVEEDAENYGRCHVVGREGDFSAVHCYAPKYGASICFFMWQAMLIAMEYALKPHCKGLFFCHVPVPCKTLMTVMAGGCVAHWFAEPYVHSNFFRDAESGLYLWKIASSK